MFVAAHRVNPPLATPAAAAAPDVDRTVLPRSGRTRDRTDLPDVGLPVVAPPVVTPPTGAPEVAGAHAWMPSSPCGAGCIDPPMVAGTARVIARVAALAALVTSYPLAHLAVPAARRAGMQRGYARAALRCLGMELTVIDKRATDATRDGTVVGEGVLVVAGHIGWTDVLALTAVRPMGFVARADLVGWPVLGTLARLARVVPIERERLRALPATVARVTERLAAGESIAVFPEGTTWCGRAYGSLRPAFFQAAVDAGAPVQPVRLRYLDRSGAPCTVAGFVGADSFADSAWRVLRATGLSAEIVLEPVEHPGRDRRDLARRCERAVRGEDRPRHDRDGAVGAADTRWIVATATRVEDPSPVPAPRSQGDVAAE